MLGLSCAQRSYGAINCQGQVVLIADGHLARPNVTFRAALKVQRYTGIIIHSPACNVRTQRRAQRRGALACDEARKVEGMGTNIANRPAARLRSIHAPFGLFVIV